MNKELLEALTALCKEKGISPEIITEALEAALVAAYKKNFNSAQNVAVTIDGEKGGVKVMAQKTVVEEVEDEFEQICLDDARAISGHYQIGDIVNIEVTPKNFGRIAAMTAKQVVTQRLREAERGIICICQSVMIWRCGRNLLLVFSIWITPAPPSGQGIS